MAARRADSNTHTVRHQKRSRIALLTLIAFACGFLFLGYQGFQEREDERIDVLEHLLSAEKSGAQAETADPLFLAEYAPALRLIGVSDDGGTLGYESDLVARQVSPMIASALQAEGWQLDESSQQGLMSMHRSDADTVGGQPSFLLIQCMDAGQGASIVVRMW